MITKRVTMYGEQVVLACDGRCDKAWGINGRPRICLSSDAEDHVYLPDSVLGTAPPQGRTNTLAEGRDAKPSAVTLTDGERLNRWCARECERGGRYVPGEKITVRDLERPTPNIPDRPAPLAFGEHGPRALVAGKAEAFTADWKRVRVPVCVGDDLAAVAQKLRARGAQ